MITVNFAVALVTVVVRGLIERFLPKAPVPQTSIIPQSAGLVLLAGTIYLIYNHLVNGKRLHITFRARSARKTSLPTNFQGRINKFRSLSERKNLVGRPRVDRLREDLLEATKGSGRLLQGLDADPSTFSISSKCSSSSFKYKDRNNSEEDERPNTSMYSARDMTMPTTNQKPDAGLAAYRHNYKGCGCGDYMISADPKKQSRTIKTRSGKKYSFYV